MAARKEKRGKRERRFNDAEKCDLVDIICNEETTNAGGDQDEPVLVKLRSKTISNEEKASLYRSVVEQLAGRGYEIRNPKRIKRMCIARRSKSSRKQNKSFHTLEKRQKMRPSTIKQFPLSKRETA